MDSGAAVPEVPGFVVARATAADASEWTRYAVLDASNRHVSAPVTSEADLAAMIGRTQTGDANAPILFCLRAADSGRLVGSVGFHSVSSANRSAEVTFGVHPDCWGQGVASAACAGAVRWGFRERGWARIQGTALDDNIASQRVLQKCGFEFEGRLRNFRVVRGQPRDFLLYACVPGAQASSSSAGKTPS